MQSMQKITTSTQSDDDIVQIAFRITRKQRKLIKIEAAKRDLSLDQFFKHIMTNEAILKES